MLIISSLLRFPPYTDILLPSFTMRIVRSPTESYRPTLERKLSSLGIDELVNKKLIRVSTLTDAF